MTVMTLWTPLPSLLAALWMANALQPAVVAAQTIHGNVTEEGTRRPLAAVTVTLLDPHLLRVASAVTSEAGQYEFSALRPGTYWIRLQLPGFEANNVGPITIGAGERRERSADLRRLAPVVLDTVVVAGHRVPPYLEDFYRRMSQKAGSFLTQKDIERYWPAEPTDLVPRLSGFDLVFAADGEVYVRTKRPASLNRASCKPLLFVDGAMHGTPDNMNDFLSVEQIAAIEAYDGPATMPPEFNAPGSACGVIAVWTKR